MNIEELQFVQKFEQEELSETTTTITVESQVKKGKKNNLENSKRYKWTDEQNTLYIRFLKRFSERLQRKDEKRFNKFEKMSFFVESKSANQCRSHHQKMMIRFETIQNVIKGLTLQIQRSRLVGVNSEQTIEPIVRLEEESINQPSKVIKKQQEEQKSVFQQMILITDEEIFDVLF